MADYNSREQMLRAFGPYAIAFEPLANDKTPYLSLLNLPDARAREVVKAVRGASGEPRGEACLVTLLEDVNWRPHLVGAVSLYFQPSSDAIARAWRAVDAGSWVTPQLVASLSLVDTSFVENAVQRLVRGCELTRDRDDMIDSPIERHSAQGPSGDQGRRAKTAASLLAVLAVVALGDERIDNLGSDSELALLADSDVDGSGAIATAWRTSFVSILNSLPPSES